MDGWMDGQTDGRTNGWTNKWTDGQTYVRMDVQTYRWTDKQTDGRTDGKSPHSTGLRPLLGPLPKKVHLAVLREYYWSLPSWKAAKENGFISGVNIVVWELQWGSPGSQMADTLPLAMDKVG